jgi:Arm DNA-binding domain
MSKMTPKTSISGKTVEAAVKRAAKGAVEEILDAACKGLTLRLRGGAVSWTIRPEWDGKRKRFILGDHTVEPDTARERALTVKRCCRNGVDPTKQVVEWATGMPTYRQEARGPKSISWEDARKLFLDHIFTKRSEATYDDYKNILQNTPELARFEGKAVAKLTDSDVAAVYADVAKRSEAHAEHVQRVLASMWSHLANAQNKPQTGVVPDAIAHVKAPERARQKLEDIDEEEEGAPDRLEIGRYMAISKLGVFGPRMSSALLLLAGTAQRRRPVAGSNSGHFQTFDDEELWGMRPYFRKPAQKKRSRGRHLVPAIGFAAEAVRRLDRLAGDQPWLMPVARARRKGQQPKRPHIDPRAINEAIESMPGVSFSTHAFRAALATYGPQDLGWLATDAKLILNHLEGFDPGDVTAQHYNTNPELLKKRRMMREWVTWLEAQEAKAIAAEPTLLDREAVAEQVYRIRYGDDAWKRACKRKKKPWQRVDKMEFKEAAE